MAPVAPEDYEAAAAWALGRIHALHADTSGTVHRTVFVDAERGRFVLRVYRHTSRAPIEREHGVIQYAHQRGVPAVAPLALPDGSTVFERDGCFYALFPFARGVQLPRAALGSNEAQATGACLAQLHLALREFPHEHAQRRAFTASNEATLARMAQIEQAIVSSNRQGDDEKRALALLEGMRAYILSTPAPEAPLDMLPLQLIHGDFHEHNLFFDNGLVSAVIDWDQTYLAPRAWEIMRAMHFVWNFAGEPCRTFLAAYHAVSPLSGTELDHAACWYAWSRGHNLWVLEATYLGENERTRQFIGQAGFEPLEPRWQGLRISIQDML